VLNISGPRAAGAHYWQTPCGRLPGRRLVDWRSHQSFDTSGLNTHVHEATAIRRHCCTLQRYRRACALICQVSGCALRFETQTIPPKMHCKLLKIRGCCRRGVFSSPGMSARAHPVSFGPTSSGPAYVGRKPACPHS
jgi:hypothetical protein